MLTPLKKIFFQCSLLVLCTLFCSLFFPLGPVALVSGEVLSKGQRLTGSNPELSRATSLEPTGTLTTSRLATTHDYSVRVSS